MTIPKDAKCCHEIARGWGFTPCGKSAKTEHQGRLYCGIHDPVRVAAKRDELQAKWKAEGAARIQAMRDARDKQAALEQDAARYRWIRGRCRHDAFTAGVEWEWYEQDPEVLDAAVDAAMKAP
jgi:hypothetical protein